jgi:hypothetical protein
MAISNWQALCRIACFEPDYLGYNAGALQRHRLQPSTALAEKSELSVLGSARSL